MDRFPLLKSTRYWYQRGFNPPDHMGVDIFAPIHSPVVAVEPGAAWSSTEPKGGRVVYLNGQSGARYFYGHLESWALGLITATAERPLNVSVGEDLGKVGTTGNAAGKPSHVHFQIRRGDTVVDPYPELFAADPNNAGKPPDPDFLDSLSKGIQETIDSVSKGLGQMSSGFGLAVLVYALISAARDRK